MTELWPILLLPVQTRFVFEIKTEQSRLSLQRVHLAHSRTSSPDKFICHWNSSAYFPKQTVWKCLTSSHVFSVVTKARDTTAPVRLRSSLCWEREASWLWNTIDVGEVHDGGCGLLNTCHQVTKNMQKHSSQD